MPASKKFPRFNNVEIRFWGRGRASELPVSGARGYGTC